MSPRFHCEMPKGGLDAIFREILARKDIDAVVVATPDHWRVPIAIMAARTGKDCYVEKPLGICVEQSLLCRKVIQEQEPRLPVWHPAARSFGEVPVGCELVRNGRIGKIRALEVVAPNGGTGGSTQEVPVPPDFDYEAWLSPNTVELTVKAWHAVGYFAFSPCGRG